MIWMPGRSQSGDKSRASEDLTVIERNLSRYVNFLAQNIGERNYLLPTRLEEAARYIQAEFTVLGYSPVVQTYGNAVIPFKNIEVTKRGAKNPEEIVVIGAHYDTLQGSPGADDNASGVAVLLELSRLLKSSSLSRTVRFVAFTNEERPHADTELMGSRVYAKQASDQKDAIVAMISLESLGVFVEKPQSQRYPPPLSWFYPSTGNFVGFVANFKSRSLVHRAIAAFRAHAQIPSVGVSVPDAWVPDIRRSDHSSFWDVGYPAIMITDTAPFRYPHYHTAHDLPENLAYPEMAAVTLGLGRVVVALAQEHEGN